MTDYEWLTSMGLCHKCRKEKVAPGKKYCFDCLYKMREYNAKRYNPEVARNYQKRRREIYQQKKASGICVRCSNPATHRLYCYDHYIEERRKSSKRAEIRRNMRYDRGLIPENRKEKGLCLWCGKPTVPGLQCCAEHRRIFSDAGKKAYEENIRNGNNPFINEVVNWKKKNNWKPSGNT